jgi:Domain of unknown function (DUF4062)
MTSVYISSTYSDLIKHREAVVQTILKMKKIVVSMEYYTASDERPLDKCLADVAECDIYIGIFAFRHGFVPDHDNPNNLSITELEHQQARKCNKPCLIFIADEVGWPLTSSDFYTGEGAGGEKIKGLRAQLNHDYNRGALFKSPEDLAASVSTALANLLEKNQPRAMDAVAEKAAPAAVLPREITSDLFVAYSNVDAGFAADLADYLNSRKLRTVLDERALFASTAEDFQRLERSVRSCHAGAVLVSDTSLRQLEERRKAVTAVLGILEGRTQNLFAICCSDESVKKMMEWPLASVERHRLESPRSGAGAQPQRQAGILAALDRPRFW